MILLYVLATSLLSYPIMILASPSIDAILPYPPPHSKARVVSALGDTKIRTDAYSTSNVYSSSSDNAVTHMSTYADTLSTYNHDYVKNKTKVTVT